MNIFGEGYIFGGFIGVIIISSLIGFFISIIDRFNSENIFNLVFFIQFIAMTFYIYRGDLLSTLSFAIGILMSFIYTYLIIRSRYFFINKGR